MRAAQSFGEKCLVYLQRPSDPLRDQCFDLLPFLLFLFLPALIPFLLFSSSSSSPPSSPSSSSSQMFAVIYNWGIYGGIVSSTVLALGCVLAACCCNYEIRQSAIAWATLNYLFVVPGGASTRESHPGLLLSSLTPHVGSGAVGASMSVYDCGHAKKKKT